MDNKIKFLEDCYGITIDGIYYDIMSISDDNTIVYLDDYYSPKEDIITYKIEDINFHSQQVKFWRITEVKYPEPKPINKLLDIRGTNVSREYITNILAKQTIEDMFINDIVTYAEGKWKEFFDSLTDKELIEEYKEFLDDNEYSREYDGY